MTPGKDAKMQTRTDPMREQPRIRAELEHEDECDQNDDDLPLFVHRVHSEQHHQGRDVDADDRHRAFVSHEVLTSITQFSMF